MEDKPIRIQRKRTKGWEMPPNTVYVGRPTKWGNPYTIIYDKSVDCYQLINKTLGYSNELITGSSDLKDITKVAVKKFEEWCQGSTLSFKELKGKNLACFCPLDRPCHADILLKLANN